MPFRNPDLMSTDHFIIPQVKFLISGRHRTAVTLTSTHTLPVVSRSAVPDVLCERRDHDEPERCQAGGESEIPGAHP